MKIFFEEYQYPSEVITPVFQGPGLDHIFSLQRGGKSKTNHIGYLFVKNKNYDGPIFILPKSFLGIAKDGTETVLGLDHLIPEKCIDVESAENPLYNSQYDTFLPELGLWLYQALRHFREKHSATKIIEDAKLEHLAPKSDSTDNDFLETALLLVDFLQDHRNLFTQISLINHSGNARIDWNKTISTRTAYKFDGEMYYLDTCIKDKTINIDEQLLILYYSILSYLKTKYHFPINLGDPLYPIRPATDIQDMIDNGTGTKTLQRIRHLYYREDLKELWRLVYNFFSYNTTRDDSHPKIESTLASNVDVIFQDMIDELIGDLTGSVSEKLKTQKDDKLIDHIFRFRSLLSPDYDIFYIGDSKYYPTESEIKGPALYKQYTYARNVIQTQIDDINLKGPGHGIPGSLRYRDSQTEGYNVTPNFFIKPTVERDNISYDNPHLNPTQKEYPVNKHFENRLFDRDTLFIREYKINLLFLIYAYASQENHKLLLRTTIRKDLIRFLNDHYEFYRIYPDYVEFGKVKGENSIPFLTYFFSDLTGKIYKEEEFSDCYILAFEKNPKDPDENTRILNKIAPHLLRPAQQFQLTI